MGIVMKPSCPRCFSGAGQSVVMEFNNNVYHCPKHPAHKYTLDTNGFFIPFQP